MAKIEKLIRKNSRTVKGASILEFMVACAIFLSAYLMIIGVFPIGYSGIDKSRKVEFATNFAQMEMERARSLTFDSSHNATANYTVTSRINGRTLTSVYTCTTTESTEFDDSETMAIKRLVVQVSWTDTTGARYVRMETEIYKLY